MNSTPPASQPLNIPTLDLSTCTPAELVTALALNSCVFLTNHGLTRDELCQLLRTSAEFYALPEVIKAKVQWSGVGPWLGWQPVYQGGPNAMLLERFEVSLTPGGHTQPLADWAQTFTHWPDEPTGMITSWSAVYHRLHALASRLTVMIADGLDLPRADLPAWTTEQHANLVVNHYLTQDEEPAAGRVRQRPHTDIGGFTLLWADDSPGGLQVRRGADWLPVEFPPDVLLLQAGDLLNLWSSGRIPANLHQVVNPPRHPEIEQTDRYSVAFFHHPNLATWVAPAAAERQQTVLPDSTDARTHVLARQRQSMLTDANRTN